MLPLVPSCPAATTCGPTGGYSIAKSRPPPAGLAIAGDEATVVAGLDRFRAARASDLILYPIRSDHAAVQRIWRLAAAM